MCGCGGNFFLPTLMSGDLKSLSFQETEKCKLMSTRERGNIRTIITSVEQTRNLRIIILPFLFYAPVRVHFCAFLRACLKKFKLKLVPNLEG